MNSTIERSESGGNAGLSMACSFRPSGQSPVIYTAEDLDEFRLLERTEILPPQGLIHTSAQGGIAYLFNVPAQRDAFVAAAWAAVDDPADARVALHGAPLGA